MFSGSLTLHYHIYINFCSLDMARLVELLCLLRIYERGGINTFSLLFFMTLISVFPSAGPS